MDENNEDRDLSVGWSAETKARTMEAQARTIGILLSSGFTPESSVEAVVTENFGALEHMGSVPMFPSKGES